MKLKILKALCVALVVAVLFAGCAESKKSGGVLKLQSGEVYVESVVKIGDREVPFELYRYWFLTFKQSIEESSPKIDWTKKENLNSLKEHTLNQIKFNYAVRDIAEKYSVNLSSEQLSAIEGNIKSTFEEVGGAPGFNKWLKENFLTMELYKELLIENELYNTLSASLAGTDKEKNKVVFTSDEALDGCNEDFYRLVDIYYAVEMVDKEDTALSTAQIEANKAAAKKKIDKVYDKLKSGSDFLKLMKEHKTDEEYKNSLLGHYHAESLTNSFGYDISSLKIGEFSEPIYANNSYLILYRMENDSEYLKEKGVSIDGFNVLSVEEYYAEKVFGEMVEKTADEYKVTELEFYNEINPQTLV